MTPVKGSSLGLLGGDCRRYPGGTENTSILRTVSRWSPNTREASRMLIPSAITALQRTRRYRNRSGEQMKHRPKAKVPTS